MISMKQHNTYLHNPGYLKIELMLKGIRVGDEVLEGIGLGRRDRGYEPVTGGVDLLLPQDTWVNAPYLEEFVSVSPYALIERDGRHFITDGRGEIEVTIVPRPRFYNLTTTGGIPLSRVGVVHGGYVAITPVARCDFFNSNVECRYCSARPNQREGNDTSYSVEDVLETVEAAYKEGKAEIIYLSIGFAPGPDGGIEFLKPYIKAIKRHFNTLVAVEALPPKEDRWIDETYAIGADSILYNMEIFDPRLFEEICPGRAALVGRERCIEALRHAATVFPNGTVASHLIVGLEPPESTIKGIDLLTGMGVVPILPIYRPSAGAIRLKMPSTEVIAGIYGYLYKAVKRNRINMTWVRDISIVTTPLEGRFFVGDGARWRTFLQKFYRSSIGLKMAWGLATLRRRLRVKEVSSEL